MRCTVSAIQYNPVVGDIAGNLGRMADLVGRAVNQGAELVVLPEICDIGYDLDRIKDLAEGLPNRSSGRFCEIARDNKIILVAGMAERRRGSIYNTAVVFGPGGDIISVYDKTHLCPIPPIDEPGIFKPGSKISVIEVAGIRIGITICYDIRFPEVYRKIALDGAQIILHPTAFPRVRIEQLEICCRTRALENQLFIISADHCGFAGKIEMGGRSMIVGPEGDIRASANETEETIVLEIIDLADIDYFRKNRPIIFRRRPEIY